MFKEVVFVYDTPSTTWDHIMKCHNLNFYLKFFDKIRVLYWSKERKSKPFEKEGGKIVFYPYPRFYNSGYITGIRYMAWIFKTAWKISNKNKNIVFVPLIPIWSGLPTLLVAKMRRKKVVLRVEANKMQYMKLEDIASGVPHLATKIKIFLLEIIYYLTMPFYDHAIAISWGTKKHIQAYGAKKATVIPIKMSTKRFRPGERPKKGNLILAVGQIKKRKGFGEIVKALGSLREKGFSFKLAIAGEVTNPKDDIFLKEIKKRAREKNLSVDFKGHLPQEKLAKLYAKADIFVHASYAETLGMVIMEAMLSELPVVTTKTDGGRYLVEDGKNGFLVPIRSSKKVEEKIELLLKNPDLREKLGKAGRKRIEKLMEEAHYKNERLWRQVFKS